MNSGLFLFFIFFLGGGGGGGGGDCAMGVGVQWGHKVVLPCGLAVCLRKMGKSYNP